MTAPQIDQPTTTAPDPRFWLGVVVPLAGIILAGLALVISWLPRLPADMAQQWDWSSREVNTVGPLWSNMLLMFGSAAAFLVYLCILKWSGKLIQWGRRLTVLALSGLVFFLVGAAPVMLRQQVGITDPLLAPDPRADVLLLALAGLAYGVLCAFITGGRPLENTAVADVPAMDLGTAEVAVWNEQVTAWIFVIAGGVGGLALLAASMTTSLWLLAPIGGVLLILGVVCGRWSVTVDRHGLTCTTRLGLGRFSMAPDAMSVADVVEVRGLTEFLGWGLRIGSNHSIAIVFHNGKALRVQDAIGRSLTVTVKDPDTAAALFNAQAARRTVVR